MKSTKTTCKTCGAAIQKVGSRAFDLDPATGRLYHSCPKDDAMPEQASIWDDFAPDLTDFPRVPKGERGAGTPLIRPIGGGEPVLRYKRTTNYIGAVEDSYGVEQWRKQLTIAGVLGDDDLAGRCREALTRRDDPVTSGAAWWDLISLCEDSFVAAGGEDAANRGTHMHTLSDYIDRGEALPVGTTPAEMADLDAYRKAVAALTPVHIEVKLVHDDLEVAGTADRVWRYQGRNYIGDLKTGKIDGRKCAMQTALYARSQLYDVKTGERSHLDVDQDRALIVHLPYGEATARALWVDIRKGWEGVELCQKVYGWRKVNGLTTAFASFDPLAVLINNAGSAETLAGLWRQWRDEWTADHTALAAARKAELTAVA